MLQFNISCRYAWWLGNVIIALLIICLVQEDCLSCKFRQGIREFKGAVDGVKNEIEEADKSFDDEKIKLTIQKLKIKSF